MNFHCNNSNYSSRRNRTELTDYARNIWTNKITNNSMYISIWNAIYQSVYKEYIVNAIDENNSIPKEEVTKYSFALFIKYVTTELLGSPYLVIQVLAIVMFLNITILN